MHGLAAVAPSSAGISFLGIIVLIILLVAYFIPGIVASVRHVPNQASVWIINIFLGWTLVGWVVALAMAARSQLPAQQVIVQQGWQQPPPGYQPYGPQQPQPWGPAQPQQDLGQQPGQPQQQEPWHRHTSGIGARELGLILTAFRRLVVTQVAQMMETFSIPPWPGGPDDGDTATVHALPLDVGPS